MKSKILLYLILMFLSASVWADSVQQTINWHDLNPAVQDLLMPLQDKWDGLPQGRKIHLTRGAERWLQASPEQRSKMQERFKVWNQLPPAKRKLVRQRFIMFNALSPVEKKRLIKKFKQFRKLSPEKRKAIRLKWNRMTPAERQRAKRKIQRIRQLTPRQRRILRQRAGMR